MALAPLDPSTCYRALRARDRRFDGLFFVGVRTTGIYCRPICPARTPRADRCSYFGRAAEAERAGFRACFRCRPELAPGLAAVDAVSRLARTAAARIDAGYLNDHSIEDLAGAVGVTSRHLRRAMELELGVTPIELAQSRRLALAKQLLQDSRLPLASVAGAAGFASIRRFNALFRARFGRAPSALRREHGAGDAADFISLRLDYRPPLDWDALLGFLGARAIPGVEIVAAREYRRSVTLGGQTGWIAVSAQVGDSPRPTARGAARGPHTLRARVSLSLAPRLTETVARLRALFDLDARPDAIAAHLAGDPILRRQVAAHPGLRVPGAFDVFETAVRAVLGQQVSVRAATTLAGRVAAKFGRPFRSGLAGIDRSFPTAAALARADLGAVRAVGLPATRARTILALARAVAGGRLDLSGEQPPDQVMDALQRVPGIGAWTAQYVAMRALRWPDAFPAGDLAVRKALAVTTDKAAEERASAWRPWRAYAVLHLWSALARGG